MTATRTEAAVNRPRHVVLALMAVATLLARPLSFVAAASPPPGLAAAPVLQAATPGPQAATPGNHIVQGNVVNGTAGAASPNGLGVTLHGYDDFAVSVTLTATADSTGAFTFENVPDVTGRYYLLSVPYEGVPYSSDLLKFGPNITTLTTKVNIWEATSDLSVLQITQVHLLFDLASDGATVTEICLFSNMGGRTFVPPSNAGLTIPVPTGAAAVAVQNQQGSILATRTVEGLQITAPMLPGPSTAELIYTFRLLNPQPTFEQTLPLPVDSLSVFIPTGGAAIKGASLADGGQQTFQSKPYHVFTGGKVAAGQKIGFQVTGGATSGLGPVDSNLLLVVGLGLLNVVLLLVIGLLLWRRGAFAGLPWHRARRGRAQDDLDAPRIPD